MTSRWAATSSRVLRRNSSTRLVAVGGWRADRRVGAATCFAGRRPPGRYWPSAVRIRWPFRIQPGLRGTSVAETIRASRPVNSAAGSTGTPASGQLGEGPQQPGQARLAGGVHGRPRVRPVAEDLADQLGQHPAGAGLDEHAGAGRVHRLDLLDEPHRRARPARPAWPGSRRARPGRARRCVLATRPAGRASPPRAGRARRRASRPRRPPAGCGTRRPPGCRAR